MSMAIWAMTIDHQRAPKGNSQVDLGLVLQHRPQQHVMGDAVASMSSAHVNRHTPTAGRDYLRSRHYYNRLQVYLQ
jgi:hypothetical protein